MIVSCSLNAVGHPTMQRDIKTGRRMNTLSVISPPTTHERLSFVLYLTLAVKKRM